MEQRVNALKSAGIDTEFHKYPNLSHGFGLGTGTVAEDWINNAVRFWEKHFETPVRITISGNGALLYATLYDNQTAREFAGLLPLTLITFDRIGLVKSTRLPQSISDNGERTRKYSLGSIFYWPEGPEVAFCYSDHLPETVVNIIHIGKIESGVEFFRDYTGEIVIKVAD
jgi:hypothetical protein